MPAELLTSEQRAPSPAAGRTAQDDHLREWARTHVERVHRLKLHVAAFVLGMAVLTPIWALVEWQANGGFERWSDDSNPGDWEPWILYVALVWVLVLGIMALRTYLDRPATEAEIDRQVERLRSGA